MAETNKKATVRNIAAIARAAAPKAIEKLEALIDDPDPKVAIAAAAHILDRAVGKPLAMTADVTDRLDEFTDDELDAAIASIQDRIGVAAKAESEKGPTATTH
jgi:hypothetical protein